MNVRRLSRSQSRARGGTDFICRELLRGKFVLIYTTDTSSSNMKVLWSYTTLPSIESAEIMSLASMALSRFVHKGPKHPKLLLKRSQGGFSRFFSTANPKSSPPDRAYFYWLSDRGRLYCIERDEKKMPSGPAHLRDAKALNFFFSRFAPPKPRLILFSSFPTQKLIKYVLCVHLGLLKMKQGFIQRNFRGSVECVSIELILNQIVDKIVF